jgi:hypothetical protein
MRLKTQRKAIYAAMGLMVISLIGGFALAAVPLGQTATSAQGSESIEITAVTGLNFLGASLNYSAGPVPAHCTDVSTPCDLGTNSYYNCTGGVLGSSICATGDWIEMVVFNTTHAATLPAGTLTVMPEFTVGGVPYSEGPLYFTQSSNTAVNTFTLYFDLGPESGSPAALSSVNIAMSVN